MTYTDALHTTATAVNLSQTPMSIQRGEAVERKAITFNASWTANTYTLRLHHNDGTTAIYENAFNSNGTITSVTIPASMTSIGGEAFYNCTALATVHVLASTPPMLSSYAFYLEDDNKSLARTFNVRSADYKTASGWADIYNKKYDYAGYTGTELRVVSTLALPDGFSTNATPVAIAGTDYYAECTSITLSYTGSASLESIKVNGSSDGVTNNGNDTFTFTMPAEDVTVSATWLDPHVITSYVDANGNLHENIAAIPLDNTMTTLEAGTYVVNSNVTYTSTVTTPTTPAPSAGGTAAWQTSPSAGAPSTATATGTRCACRSTSAP